MKLIKTILSVVRMNVQSAASVNSLAQKIKKRYLNKNSMKILLPFGLNNYIQIYDILLHMTSSNSSISVDINVSDNFRRESYLEPSMLFNLFELTIEKVGQLRQLQLKTHFQQIVPKTSYK
ncbi:hypothetical protein TRFO_39415 [Tritrichomonas foetus]|uniref:Uncharacterized protein n=1 Tax=Tritrichomonas foetus TaxID=1144522 RepID=A0A1J4J9S7_9EUKA|nr:hypothetical protein TRFO_39415 [Tritrichomonas foetus]|eukprot:OHS94403.1 hypothetical protein TRFO_39415 [Tritrichomonas foetus]